MKPVFEILWSRSSVRDLDEVLGFLAESAGVEPAMKLYEELRRRIATLPQQPRRCRRIPEFRGLGLPEHRELILPPYRVFFRLQDRQIMLLGILDSRRDLEELLVQRALETD